MNQLINYEGVYRTVPATLGLLITKVFIKQPQQYKLTIKRKMIPTKVLQDVGFQKKLQEKFKIMGQDREFSDVTLTSKDGVRFLAATSTYFREYFHRQKGINSIFLASMLDMVYFGEARVRKVNCSSFFRFLQDCKVVESKMCKEGNDIHSKSRFVCVVKTLLLKMLRKKMCKKYPKSPIKDEKMQEICHNRTNV